MIDDHTTDRHHTAHGTRIHVHTQSIHRSINQSFDALIRTHCYRQIHTDRRIYTHTLRCDNAAAAPLNVDAARAVVAEDDTSNERAPLNAVAAVDRVVDNSVDEVPPNRNV